jgi:hypothetical protein
MLSEERNSNDLKINVIKESYMLNTVSQVVDNDIERGNSSSNNSSSNNSNERVVLKGILKKSNNVDHEARTGLMVIKLCTTLLMIVLTMPIIVCDLYFGFSDNSCISEMPDGFNYTMKLYLLVSGFMGLSWLLFIIYTTSSLSINNDNTTSIICAGCIGLIVLIFNLIWNILGAVTFWGSIYKGGQCDSETSTYIYVSLIIKFVATLIALQQNSNKKE